MAEKPKSLVSGELVNSILRLLLQPYLLDTATGGWLA